MTTGDRQARVRHLSEVSTGSSVGGDPAPAHARQAARSAPSIALRSRAVPLQYDSLDDPSVSGHFTTRVVTFHDDQVDIHLEITLDDKRKLVGRISPRAPSVDVRSPADVVTVDVAESGDFVAEGLIRGPVTIVVDGPAECHTEWVVI